MIKYKLYDLSKNELEFYLGFSSFEDDDMEFARTVISLAQECGYTVEWNGYFEIRMLFKTNIEAFDQGDDDWEWDYTQAVKTDKSDCSDESDCSDTSDCSDESD